MKSPMGSFFPAQAFVAHKPTSSSAEFIKKKKQKLCQTSCNCDKFSYRVYGTHEYVVELEVLKTFFDTKYIISVIN